MVRRIEPQTSISHARVKPPWYWLALLVMLPFRLWVTTVVVLPLPPLRRVPVPVCCAPALVVINGKRPDWSWRISARACR